MRARHLIKWLADRKYVWTVVIGEGKPGERGKVRERIFNDEAKARACYGYHRKRLDKVALLKSRRVTWLDNVIESRIIWFRRQFHIVPLVAVGLIAGAIAWAIWWAVR